jgi:DNA modification methylase
MACKSKWFARLHHTGDEWGLRDYGTASWAGGSEGCDHLKSQVRKRLGLAAAGNACDGGNRTQAGRSDNELWLPYGEVCGKCGARRIDAQIGLEGTIDEYVQTMVEVFREVRRVLADDGTLWLNLGSSYAGGGNNNGNTMEIAEKQASNCGNRYERKPVPSGFKPKDLIPTPWLVAMALQQDGWWLRQDIIFSKRNPMPESVIDRFCKSHEYLFLLSKKPNYFFDSYAVREPCSNNSHGSPHINPGWKQEAVGNNQGGSLGQWTAEDKAGGRTRRSVWEIATQPFSGSHFAVFPEALVEPCILAGSSERGHCPGCGKRWARVVERKSMVIDRSSRTHPFGRTRTSGTMLEPPESKTLRWKPGCVCGLEPVPDVVLDPFCGSNTVGRVAERLGRHWLGIELSAAYGEMAKKRTEGITQSIFL